MSNPSIPPELRCCTVTLDSSGWQNGPGWGSRRHGRARLMKKALILGLVAAGSLLALPAQAAGDAEHPKSVHWSFDGVFGHYDRASLQRGLQVYKEVCSACHSMNQLAFRNLSELGYTEDEVKAEAASWTVPGVNPDAMLAPFFAELGQIGGLRASLDILKLFKSGVFKTKVASVNGLEDYPAALDAYAANMTDGKAILKIS